jgi:hypothetical protein
MKTYYAFWTKVLALLALLCLARFVSQAQPGAQSRAQPLGGSPAQAFVRAG